MVRDRRLNKPSHIKALMAEQINILRKDETLDKIKRAHAIAYLSNTALSAYKDSEAMEEIKEIKQLLDRL